MVVNKLEAARIQLDAAIDHYFNGNLACSITLAGAAEDILAGLTKNAGEMDSFEFLYKSYKLVSKEELSKKSFSWDVINLARNWLKHANDDPETEFDLHERDALMIIMRAMPMHKRLAGVDTDQMKRFDQYLKQNEKQVREFFGVD